jgi:hypothetical protein
MEKTEEEYASYLLDRMTVDMSIDFYQTKQCAINCVEEILKHIDSPSDKIIYLQKVKQILESK